MHFYSEKIKLQKQSSQFVPFHAFKLRKSTAKKTCSNGKIPVPYRKIVNGPWPQITPAVSFRFAAQSQCQIVIFFFRSNHQKINSSNSPQHTSRPQFLMCRVGNARGPIIAPFFKDDCGRAEFALISGYFLLIHVFFFHFCWYRNYGRTRFAFAGRQSNTCLAMATRVPRKGRCRSDLFCCSKFVSYQKILQLGKSYCYH